MWEIRRDLHGRFQPKQVNHCNGTGQDPQLPLLASNPSTHRKHGEYCQDYPPVTLSELRISLITKEFKDPVNLILFALPLVWHWCSRESIGWKWGTPNCICIATRNQVHKCYDFLRQRAVSANLSRRPEIDMACGSRASSEENKNDGIFFPITSFTSIKKRKKSKCNQMSLR